MKANLALGLTLLTLSTAGCISDESAESQEDFGSENDIRVTYNGDVALLGSYHELFDKSADTPCVKYQDGGLYARVSEPARNLSIDMVSSKEDLARKLGVDLNVKARYGVIAGNAAVNLLDEYSSSSNSVSYLLEARNDYVVRDHVQGDRAIILSEAGVKALSAGPNEFVRRCGTHYLNAVRYGARFYILITYKAMSHESKLTMDASLGIDGSIAASGDIKTRLETTAKQSGVHVTIKTASTGFQLQQAPSGEIIKAFESAKVDQALFSAAAKLYLAMAEAVQQDYCMDSGEAQCKGQQSPGYFNRTRRDTSVTGAQLASYHSLGNATNSAAFGKIKKRVEAVNRYLRAYSETQVRMESIYNDEIRPFLDADQKQKAMYNVAPPGKPLRTPQDVYNVAKKLDELIYPPTGGVMGTLRADIHDRIAACLDAVNVDITASCTKGEQYSGSGQAPNRELEAEETKAYNQLYGFFDDYHDTKRILPLAVSPAPVAVGYGLAKVQCDVLATVVNRQLEKAGSSNKVVYRLPKYSEVLWLAPMLSHGAVKWSGASIANATWYAPEGSKGSCGSDHPYLLNEPGSASATFACAVDDWWDDALVPLCVPASGPTPLLPPQ